MKKLRLTKWVGMLLVGAAIMMTGCSSGTTATPQEGSFVTEVKEDNAPIATIDIAGYGTIEAELYPSIAPNTVNNFIHLANNGYYDGLIIHRVEKNFVLQGGDPNGNGTGGPGYTIPGEFANNGYSTNNLAHIQGVLSMARTNAPDSAGSQFFIMTGDAPHLDGSYAAFGKVISGLDIVMNINDVVVSSNSKPAEDVIINSITVDTKGIDYPEPEKTNK